MYAITGSGKERPVRGRVDHDGIDSTPEQAALLVPRGDHLLEPEFSRARFTVG